MSWLRASLVLLVLVTAAPVVAAKPIRSASSAGEAARPYPSESSPLPVRLIESPADTARAKEREDKTDKHDAEDLDAQVRSAKAAEKQAINSIAQTVINALALALSFVAAVYLVKTFRETRRTADAAAGSAALARDEFISTHRPRVRFRHIILDPDMWDAGRGTIGIQCQIVNVGDTEATILEFGISQLATKLARELHPIPDYKGAKRLSSNPVLQSGDSFNLPIHTPTIDERQHGAIRDGTFSFFCYGYVTYADSLGRKRTTAFCRVLERIGGPHTPEKFCRFAPLVEKRDDYEYED